MGIIFFEFNLVVASVHSRLSKPNKHLVHPKTIWVGYNGKGKRKTNIGSVIFEIKAFEKVFKINLKKSQRSRCGFEGFVNGSSEVSAQFDLCHGLSGEFLWQDHIYFIQPTKQSKSRLGLSYPGTKLLPHFIYYKIIQKKAPHFSCQLIKSQMPKNIPNIGKSFSLRSKRSTHSDNPIIHSEIVEENRIELLIVVTNSFMKRFEKDLKQYILNNVAIATKLLRHPTINASLSIDIVDIIPLEEKYEKDNKLHNWSLLSQEKVVTKFCHWLRENKNSWNYTWDSAILINDGYFSSNAIGIAHLQSMCNDNNCLAVVDRGFGTGFIIAHELAHQMNARHDFDDVEACRLYEPKNERDFIYNTIMSTSLYFDNYPLVWSLCSQYLINTFLRSKHSSCLREQNRLPNLYTQENIMNHLQKFSTGVDYDLDQQCSFAFGEPAEHCIADHNRSKKCSTLYCRLRRHHLCVRADALIADGTQCDVEKHCVHGECISKNINTNPVDGGWSDYSPWSNCSRECDGGVQFSYRTCKNPVPSMGGRFCVGPKERVRSCNVKRCSEIVDPRAESCRKHNLKPYVPQIDEEFACNLVCITNNNALKYDIELTDGTPCSPLSADICIKGTCYKTGCDRIIGSKKVFDNCHKCGGHNDTCIRKEGTFDGSKMKRVKMITAFRVPANVTNLEITKISERNESFTDEVFDDFEILLVIDRRTVIRRSETIEPLAGGQLHYSGANKKIEVIEIKGRITKEIIVIVKMENQNSKLNLPKIHFRYYVPRDVFVWRHLDFHPLSCQNLCSGYVIVSLACFRENDNRRVMDHRCSKITKPKPLIQNCSDHCLFRWIKPNETQINRWKSGCPISCGSSNFKIPYSCEENHIIKSNENNWKPANESLCLEAFSSERPYLDIGCDGPCLPPIWSYGSWEECPIECGTGYQLRSSICIDHKGVFYNTEICQQYLGSPFQKRACLSFYNCKNLTTWIPSSWSTCSKTCGVGTQTRLVRCFKTQKNKTSILEDHFLKKEEQISDAYCEVHSQKPAVKRSCQVDECYHWTREKHGKCSVTCGNGTQINKFICQHKSDSTGFVNDEICLQNNLTKPHPIISKCFNRNCPIISFWVSMNWNKCSTSCGEGVQERIVKCGYDDEHKTRRFWTNDDRCKNITKPTTIKRCSNHPCPVWVYGVWSECEGTCLYGIQQRSVICADENTDRILPNSHCNSSVRHQTIKQCLVSKLCGFWKVGKWSRCTTTCGLGVRVRSVTCHFSNGTRSRDTSICSSIIPFEEIHCQNEPCKTNAFWSLMRTSECYGHKCNPGIMYANVRCINQKFEILADETCRLMKHPNFYAGCVNKKCRKYFWITDPWDNSQCSLDSCTVAMRNRNVQCVDDYGHIYQESFCDESTKPDTWRLCPAPKKCSEIPHNCAELKHRYPDYTDGEYNLAIDLNWTLFIYCADMNTDKPKEYLTLKELNYARTSKFLYVYKQPCVFEEEVERNESCRLCKIDESMRSITYYDKIRLNMTDLSVDVLDNRFSITNGPSYLPFATAKDCSGLISCPKGHFKIDLRGTGLSVSMKTNWNELYPKHGFKIIRSEAAQVVKGWCGGKCSGCAPLDKLYLEPQMYGRDYEMKSRDIL